MPFPVSRASVRRGALLLVLTACATAANDTPVAVLPDPALDPRNVPDVRLAPGRVLVRRPAVPPSFWEAVAALDPDAADRAARDLHERLFARALRALVDGDAAGAEILFRTLTGADDPVVRGRARVGLTVALEAQGRWDQLAALPVVDALSEDTDVFVDRAAVHAWAGVLRGVPQTVIEAPEHPARVRLERSDVGTPIVRVVVNGRRHAFWLDTGASMSLLSSDVAARSGVQPIAGSDTLAIATAAGRVAARPAVLGTLEFGPVRVTNLPVALLEPGMLRLDYRLVNGVPTSVRIDGVLGADVLRRLDVVIDPGSGALTVARPRRTEPRAGQRRTLIWIGFPVVRMLTRDGRPVLFGIDTGADSTVVTSAWLELAPDRALTSARARIDALGRTAATGLRVMRNVVVSDGTTALRMRDVPVVGERGQAFVRFDGVLGADVFGVAAMRLDVTNGVFDLLQSVPPVNLDTGFVRVRH